VAETLLEMAERHVREGERHVANQREVIVHLAAHGHSTELAKRLLKNLEELLLMHRQHLDRIKAGEA
jgi:hypothetical protein